MALESPELQLALARIQFPAVIEELLSVLHLVNDDPCNLVSLISQREAVVFGAKVILLATCSQHATLPSLVIEKTRSEGAWSVCDVQMQSVTSLEATGGGVPDKPRQAPFGAKPPATVLKLIPKSNADSTASAKEHGGAKQDQEIATAPYEHRERTKWRSPFDSQRG